MEYPMFILEHLDSIITNLITAKLIIDCVIVTLKFIKHIIAQDMRESFCNRKGSFLYNTFYQNWNNRASITPYS